MGFANLTAGLLTVMLVTPVTGESDAKPAAELARLKKEVEAAWEELGRGQGSQATEAEQKAASDRYCKQAAGLARRALVLAEAYPDAPGAADLQPMGKDFPPLGEQATGALFRLQNLEIGCAMPKLEGEDVDGKPLKLSDSQGQVVVLSFWATWCGPCMGMVPQERALVQRMKRRPFVLIGVNGDEDRAKARTVSAKEGITWRSFWDGGPHGPISVQWGVSAWPTVYLVDANGIIRNENLRGEALDRAVEALVTEVEGAVKK